MSLPAASPQPSKQPDKTEGEVVAEFLAECVCNPLLWLLGVFPWGSGDLKPSKNDPKPGPDTWQIGILQKIAAGHYSTEDALRIAVASGHGPGKSALIAWIILWFMTTKPHCNGIVTANTGAQLSGKTWREVGVWLNRMREPYRRDLVCTATKLYHASYERTWFIAAVEWSERNPEAFAGLHAKHVIVLFDEASAIHKDIWETTEGAMTTPHALWIVFGNPTKNTGQFFECFHKMRHRWERVQVDSRSAKMTNKSQLRKWELDYGEDSDFFRVRVKGVFPRAGATQFIGTQVVRDAIERGRALGQLEPWDKHPALFGALIFGGDVGWFGDDASCLWFRRGNYARRLQRHYGKSTQHVAGYFAEEIDRYDPEACFIDANGVGAGVYDRLTALNYSKVFKVTSGNAQEEEKYHNLRAEMWGNMRDWLKDGGCIYCEPDDEQQIVDDISGPEYYPDNKNRIQLEAKEDMKSRGLSSPDNGDGIGLTWGGPVMAREYEDEETEDRYGRGGKGGGSWASA